MSTIFLEVGEFGTEYDFEYVGVRDDHCIRSEEVQSEYSTVFPRPVSHGVPRRALEHIEDLTEEGVAALHGRYLVEVSLSEVVYESVDSPKTHTSRRYDEKLESSFPEVHGKARKGYDEQWRRS